MLDTTQVRDWMTASPFTIGPDEPISHAHQIMKDNRVRRLPVVDGDKLVGIITRGDVREASPSGATTLSIWELNYLWAQLTVKKVMTTTLLTVTPDSSVIEAARLMLDKKVSGLPVVNESGGLAGIITESDVFRMLIASYDGTA